MKRSAFTMLELIFVIVVMAILAKFGTELFLQTYENYTRTMITNDLDTKSEAAIQGIANRLTYRVRDSVIASTGPTDANFHSLENANANDSVIEWVNRDINGWNNANYSGIIDLNNTLTTPTQLFSPGTTLLPSNAAILFKGATVNVRSGFGWHDTNLSTTAVRRISSVAANVMTLANPFSLGDEIYEYYQVAESASALALIGDKIFYYDNYQPWNIGGANRTYDSNSGYLLVDHVKTVSVKQVGDVILVVLCLSNNDFMGEGEYSICKTKTVF